MNNQPEKFHPRMFVKFRPGYEYLWGRPIGEGMNFVQSASTIRLLDGIEYLTLAEHKEILKIHEGEEKNED